VSSRCSGDLVTAGPPDQQFVGVGIFAHGALWPFLLDYYLNGNAFLAVSSIAERPDRRVEAGRSLSFLDGLANAGKPCSSTLWLLLPFWASPIELGYDTSRVRLRRPCASSPISSTTG
jgi:hypothetical protein